MTPTISHIASRLLFGILKGLSYLPFPLLYGISSVFTTIILATGGYRRQLVWKNLQRCFPQAEPEQLHDWVRQYYGFLVDMFVETIKSISIRGEELDSRMLLVNETEASKWLSKKGGIVLASHYGNFEWTSQRMDRFMHKHGKKTAVVYARLSPVFLERAMIRLRRRWGAKMIRRHQAIRDSLRLLGEGYMIGFVIDQSPAIHAPAIHHPFLGVNTRWIPGATKLALRSGGPILYPKISRLGRGRYSLELIRLDLQESESPSEHLILARYISELEACVRTSPPFWLWSHNRWKGLQDPA